MKEKYDYQGSAEVGTSFASTMPNGMDEVTAVGTIHPGGWIEIVGALDGQHVASVMRRAGDPRFA